MNADTLVSRESIDGRAYLSEVEWLADNRINEIFFARWRNGVWSITGYENDPHAGPILSNQPRCFPPIHFRHSEVGKDKVEGAATHLLNRFVPTFGQLHSMMNSYEHLGKCLSDRPLIVNNKNT